MKIRFLADADLDHSIVAGVRRREPRNRIFDSRRGRHHRSSGYQVLSAAARQGRVLVSHDKRTMPHHFSRFVEESSCPGVLIVLQERPMTEAIEELLLIWTVTEAEEWVDRIVILPL